MIPLIGGWDVDYLWCPECDQPSTYCDCEDGNEDE